MYRSRAELLVSVELWETKRTDLVFVSVCVFMFKSALMFRPDGVTGTPLPGLWSCKSKVSEFVLMLLAQSGPWVPGVGCNKPILGVAMCVSLFRVRMVF